MSSHRVDVVLLTVIWPELDALRNILGVGNAERAKDADGTTYYRAEVRSELTESPYSVILGCLGSAGNPGAAAGTQEFVLKFRPRQAILMGIAAGLRGKVRIGDVVFGERVVAYEPAAAVIKDGREAYEPRPEIDRIPYSVQQDLAHYRPDPSRLAAAFRVAGGRFPRAKSAVKAEFDQHVSKSLRVHVSTVASGEKLLRNPAKLHAIRETQHGKVEVGEMEAVGFVEACRRTDTPWLVVRGISDFGDDLKDDRFHALASKAAACAVYDFVRFGLDLRRGEQRGAISGALEETGVSAASHGTLTQPIDAEGSESGTQNSGQFAQRDASVLGRTGAIGWGVPALPQIFLGREEDMAELKQRICGPGDPAVTQIITAGFNSVAAIRGWPGIGKTAIATMLAVDSDVSAHFPDGVLWASLGENPNLISHLAEWGRALGSDEVLRAPTVSAAVAAIARLLRSQRKLLVVDDVWEREHVEVFRQARGPDCTLLVTTRELGVLDDLALPSHRIYNLPPLTLERAVDLLRLLAPGVVASQEESCRRLAADLECLPLALNVAGRLLHVESQSGLSAERLLEELQNELGQAPFPEGGSRLLSARGPADRMDLDTQTVPSVAALLRRSTDRLNERERDCFASLGPFAPKPATFGIDALEAVWQTDDPSSVVLALVSRGLLEPVGGRFQMHSLLVLHARSLLT